MFKGSIELGRVNKSMKLKFGLILADDTSNNHANNIINRFKYNGSEYLRVSPRPFITIDISQANDKNDSWNTNNQVNLNRVGLFIFLKALRDMIRKFQEENLYYYEKKRLHVNIDLSKKYAIPVKVGNKTILMQHTVVPDEDNKEIEYEGIVFMINKIDNFCYLSYQELEFLYHELNTIDMNVLSMQLINANLLINMSNTDEVVEELKIDKLLTESTDTDPAKEQTIYAKIKKPCEVPDI